MPVSGAHASRSVIDAWRVTPRAAFGTRAGHPARARRAGAVAAQHRARAAAAQRVRGHAALGGDRGARGSRDRSRVAAYLADADAGRARRRAERAARKPWCARSAVAAAALIIRGAPGLGRSRVLDACVLEAKTLGATVLRASAGRHAGRLRGRARASRSTCSTRCPTSELAQRFPELFVQRPEELRPEPPTRSRSDAARHGGVETRPCGAGGCDQPLSARDQPRATAGDRGRRSAAHRRAVGRRAGRARRPRAPRSAAAGGDVGQRQPSRCTRSRCSSVAASRFRCSRFPPSKRGRCSSRCSATSTTSQCWPPRSTRSRAATRASAWSWRSTWSIAS